MARDITVLAATALEGTVVTPIFLCELTFSNETLYCHSSVGSIVFNGNTYLGLGAFCGISTISEQSDQTATGITLTLNGIDNQYLQDCLTFASGNGTGSVYLGFMLANGELVADPFSLFTGFIDSAEITMGVDTVSISLAIESRLTLMNRNSGLRYTDAAQRVRFPGDGSFRFVQFVADLFINWKSAK